MKKPEAKTSGHCPFKTLSVDFAPPNVLLLQYQKKLKTIVPRRLFIPALQ
jgi:hypothetical protein